MSNQRLVELAVGLFILAAFGALLVLAFEVSGLNRLSGGDTYNVSATFNNIGGLRVRAPVKVGGVEIGSVESIRLNQDNYEATVTLALEGDKPHLPKDSSASILTEGLLGSKYISIQPGFDTEMLANNDTIDETHSAMILENLVGQFLYKTSGKGKDNK